MYKKDHHWATHILRISPVTLPGTIPEDKGKGKQGERKKAQDISMLHESGAFRPVARSMLAVSTAIG